MNLATILRKRGHDIAVVSVMPFLDLEAQIKATGTDTFTLHVHSKLQLAPAVRRYTAIVRAWRPDIVHAHLASSILLSRISRLFAPVPLLIGTSHSTHEDRQLTYFFYRITNRLGDKWSSISRAGIDAHERAGAVPAGTGLHVHNGIDLSCFVRSPDLRRSLREEMGVRDDDFLWLTVGSFRDEAKDYDNLLHAFVSVTVRHPQARLMIAGDGLLLEAKRELAGRLGLGSAVQFLGVRRDVAALMSGADAFVLASRREGMPIVLLEAAAMELPIVATDVGENAALVVPNVSGFIVSPRSHAELAGAMLRAMERSPEERASMGHVAREHIRASYDIENVATEWMERYVEWLP
jgi:glycosyltransferase involved in cell wall biosynthesis